MKHYEYEINLHLDGELNDEEQIELFAHLSICRECRDTFNKYNQLRTETKHVYDKNLADILLQVNEYELKGKISEKKPVIPQRFYKIGFYTSAATAMVLLFLLAASKPREISIARNDVKADTVFVKYETALIDQTSNSGHVKNVLNVNPEASQKAYLDYLGRLKSAKITSADLIKYNTGS